MNDHSLPQHVGGVERSLAVRQMLRPISRYMADDAIREITIPRPGVILTSTRGKWQLHEVPELNFDFLEGLISAIASYNNVRISPAMSLKLADGERVQIARPPAVIDGTVSINIRKHSILVKQLHDYQAGGAFDGWRDVSGPVEDLAALTKQDRELWDLLQRRDILGFLKTAVGYRRNIIVGGKTFSGKTTFARSLIECVPTDERLITIEDVHELFLPNHPNRVHMLYGAGAGQISPTQCIEAAMRSSPDRIFLSELRGIEAWDYLSALNTGHPGSVTTTHANSARDTYSRVALLIKQSTAGSQMDIDTILRYLHSTLDISLYFSNFKLAEVYFNPGRTARI
ncbi:P-type DNA transfer ATPase VirB11 [Achromobacter dolens]|uniref:P-type DNA transfer ATPase VirB11 n=1 Tax=Achromobacter dolens TaxID=1287738 RepID=UPI0022B8CBC2|nr:P-type DNA transfer ATPase VirB11 [Achromobacter dolens]MCZ8411294.1 P-type DNA transfer ATPase VirB11 [Achromobacter dolens]